MRKLFVFLCLSTLILVTGAEAAPETKALVRKYKSALGRIQDSDKQQRAILGQLYAIHRQIKKESSKRIELEKQKTALEKRVQSVAKEYLELKEELHQEKLKLVGRIRVLATLGAKDFVRVLVNSDSAADIDRSLYLVGKIARRDLVLISNYRLGLAALHEKKSDLEKKNAEFQVVVAAYDEELNKLKDQQKQKFGLVAKIRKSKSLYLAQLKNYRFTAKEINSREKDQLAELIMRPSFFEKRGELPQPVMGPMTRINPSRSQDSRVVLSTKGILIPTRESTSVSAIFRAKVEFADFTQGYGGLVILDHGDNYYSVLGNLDRVAVAEGQEIEAGQVVGVTGQRLWRGRRGAYFEIRHFSEPEDPRRWVSPRVTLKMSQLTEGENNRIVQ